MWPRRRGARESNCAFFSHCSGRKKQKSTKKFPFFCSHQKNITPIGENAALLKAAHYCTIRGKRSISHKFVSLGLTVRALANAELKNWLDIQYFNCSDARNTFRYSDAFIQYNSSTLVKLMWSIGGKSIFTFSRHRLPQRPTAVWFSSIADPHLLRTSIALLPLGAKSIRLATRLLAPKNESFASFFVPLRSSNDRLCSQWLQCSLGQITQSLQSVAPTDRSTSPVRRISIWLVKDMCSGACTNLAGSLKRCKISRILCVRNS